MKRTRRAFGASEGDWRKKDASGRVPTQRSRIGKKSRSGKKKQRTREAAELLSCAEKEGGRGRPRNTEKRLEKEDERRRCLKKEASEKKRSEREQLRRKNPLRGR